MLFIGNFIIIYENKKGKDLGDKRGMITQLATVQGFPNLLFKDHSKRIRLLKNRNNCNKKNISGRLKTQVSGCNKDYKEEPWYTYRGTTMSKQNMQKPKGEKIFNEG